MTQPNAFAAVANAGQQSAPASSPLPFNGNDPFGRPSDVAGGAFTPNPPMEALIGRTLVYIPRSFNPTAKDPFDKDGIKTRPQWTADLYVLDGGELRFWYKQKADLNATPPRPEAQVEHVVENITPETPFENKGAWVSQAALVPKLTAFAERGQFLVCTIERGAQKADRDKGATDQSVREAHAAWVARGKNGPEPRSLWLAADLNDEQMKTVYAWWATAKDTIKL